MKSLINKKAVKEFALECAKGRFHKFTRVSSDFLIGIENAVKQAIRLRVEGQPSVGKTLMGLILCLGFYSCQPAFGGITASGTGEDLKSPVRPPVTASWYNSTSVKKEGTCHEEKCYTASGKEIHQLERDGVLFAASNDFKFGTRVKVTNRRSGKSVVVRIYDRGGFKKYGRSIDLCRQAFERIADTRQGLVKVYLEKL